MTWLVDEVESGKLNYRELIVRLQEQGVTVVASDDIDVWFIDPHPESGLSGEITTEELLHYAGMSWRQ